MEDGSRRAIIAAFFANLGIAAAKFVGFALTGASSMLAEAVHSLADTSNQGLLIIGRRRSQKLPTDQHPFGYGRERFFWSFVVALVIFSMGSLFALYEGQDKLRNPHDLGSVWAAVAILVFAIVLEGLSFRTAIRESRALKGDSSWAQFIRRAKVPELPVLLLEDLGALVGLACALGGIAAAEATGDARYDAAGSLAIGVLLAVIAATLVVEMKSLLIGESATPRQRAGIAAAIQGHAQVRRLIHMRTEHLGPEELLVGAKIEFDNDLDVVHLADAINSVEIAIRTAVPDARVIYLEPDIYRKP